MSNITYVLWSRAVLLLHRPDGICRAGPLTARLRGIISQSPYLQSTSKVRLFVHTALAESVDENTVEGRNSTTGP